MKDQLQSRLASILTFLVGAWLMLSPLFISVSGAARINVLIAGGVIGLAGLVQLAWTGNTLPSWVSALAAIWLAISAFVFDATAGFVWSATLSALAAFVLAVWDGVEVEHLQHSRHSTSTF